MAICTNLIPFCGGEVPCGLLWEGERILCECCTDEAFKAMADEDEQPDDPNEFPLGEFPFSDEATDRRHYVLPYWQSN